MEGWTDPRKDEGPDPISEGDVDESEEVDVEENVGEVDEEEAQL